ncbi:hypothetical protein CDAR_470661 [Caerostris darwini]|uniref:Uncharacterized protein n=1 Tax=Caerostris darwini TaxID=1538125 RepID=A0AAV4VIP5_9ARAC|nr:hypothetical protein CDAR_470661 [Caerostris darwini]
MTPNTEFYVIFGTKDKKLNFMGKLNLGVGNGYSKYWKTSESAVLLDVVQTESTTWKSDHIWKRFGKGIDNKRDRLRSQSCLNV